MPNDFQFLSNEAGDVTAVVVPIDAWREIASELETHHLLKSESMKVRLLAARSRRGGTPLAEVSASFGLDDESEP